MIMYIAAALIYLVLGWVVTEYLVKRKVISLPISYLFSIILWLPGIIIGALLRILFLILVTPYRYAKSRVEKA